MIINNFTKTETHPLRSIEPESVGVLWMHFDVDENQKIFLKWKEEDSHFCVCHFDKTLLWELHEPICQATFDPRNEWIWLVRRENAELVTILLYDYNGNPLTSLPMTDPIYEATFIITLLPEKTAVSIDFCGGQDGSQTYFLSLINKKLQIERELPPDVCFLFAFDNDTKAALWNFYENTIFTVSYPDLQPISEFTPTDEMLLGSIGKITDKYWLVSDDYSARHYIFNSETMTLGEEIVVKGYEPAENEDGEMESDISSMTYTDNKLIFGYAKITGKYPDIQEESWWGQTPFDIDNLT